jgi:hypothetical protein
VTQDEIDAGGGEDGLLTNFATADSDQTHGDSATSEVQVENHFDGAAFGAKSVSQWSALFNSASGNVLLGDVNHDGIANDAQNLFISNTVADAILNSASSNDVRVKMLGEAIATQLNSNTGVELPEGLIDEAIQWFTNEGSWASLGVNLDKNNDGTLDAGKIEKNGTFSLNGAAVKTNDVAWTKEVDVIDNSTGITEWDNNKNVAGNQEANGQDLYNALHAFNQKQLVTSSDGSNVGWSPSGDPANVVDVQLNTTDSFWLTLHLAGTV